MIEQFMVITNNPMSLERFKTNYLVKYIEGSTLEVFSEVRDRIHLGHKLLTHPLMSSIKPNETPYRTVLVTKQKYSGLDFDSLNIVENAIITTEKFIKDFNIPNWNESILQDFQLIDFDLIYHAIN